jgi:hypothetical protein
MCYNNSVKKISEGISVSPEQTIIIAKSCEDYEKSGSIKYPARYLVQFESCKNCAHWNLGGCQKAQDILKTID